MNSVYFKNKTLMYSVLFLSFTYFAMSADEKETPKTKLEFTLPLTEKSKSRSVTFLQDAQGRDFVLKNHRGKKYAIQETIATQIGEAAGININHVEIFPAQHPHFNQFVENEITTLHTLVPGCEVETKRSMRHEINIEDGLCDPHALETLTKFIDLCDIVALDIFTNNRDRHNANLFVYQKREHLYAFDLDFFIDQKMDPLFYAIDMDMAFYNIRVAKKDNDIHWTLSDNLLATKAYDFLEETEIMGKKFSSQEIKALRRVNKTLGKMMDQYTPEKLYTEWMSVAAKANYTYNPIRKENIKIALEYNFHEIRRLHSKIDELTK